MGRHAHWKLLLVGFAFAASTIDSRAQSGQTSPILNPTEASRPAAPVRHHVVSADVIRQLQAATPKFNPEKPKPAPKVLDDDEPDMRDIDKPKNGIIRLPKYVVRQPRPAVLSERDVHTDKGLADLAVRRYISEADRALNRFTLPIFSGFTVGDSNSPTQNRALAMYAEDERLRNMVDLTNDAKAAAKADPAAGAYILRETQKTFMRTDEFGGRR